jgi:hypothetical protein
MCTLYHEFNSGIDIHLSLLIIIPLLNAIRKRISVLYSRYFEDGRNESQSAGSYLDHVCEFNMSTNSNRISGSV